MDDSTKLALEMERIEKLCINFTDNIKRRFWTNWLLYFSPNTYYVVFVKKSKGLKMANIKNIHIKQK